jgi:hypothetical protein
VDRDRPIVSNDLSQVLLAFTQLFTCSAHVRFECFQQTSTHHNRVDRRTYFSSTFVWLTIGGYNHGVIMRSSLGPSRGPSRVRFLCRSPGDTTLSEPRDSRVVSSRLACVTTIGIQCGYWISDDHLAGKNKPPGATGYLAGSVSIPPSRTVNNRNAQILYSMRLESYSVSL